jgi:D-alanine-D-alanine ligase-like ATP-grasp enzyme
MKVCVLQPDYSTSDVDYQHYDPPRSLTALLPGHTVDHVFLNKLTVYSQLKALSTHGYDIFVNLCEGYFEWTVPSIEVIDWLDRLKLPYTGPKAAWYHFPKPLMKYVAYTAGVPTPAHVTVTSVDGLDAAVAKLHYPLFVKPAYSGDSLGVDDHSLAPDAGALRAKVSALLPEHGEAIIEEYVAGRELTVLVVASAEEGAPPVALTPVEYIFPAGRAFKTYALKTAELHPDANIAVRDPALIARLHQAALGVFEAFGGMGYARLDFRLNDRDELFFLEINFTCSVFYADGYEGSADYVLKYDPMGQAGFAERIIAEGIARHRRATPPYEMRGNAVAGYGIFATLPIASAETVFRGEGRAQRLITRRRVATLDARTQETFRHYAYPMSDQLYAFWDADPSMWAPQNHSCDPNCRFDGLDVVALRQIAPGEELTLDYATFMNEDGEEFECHCGTAACRGVVRGVVGNSVTARETRDERR